MKPFSLSKLVVAALLVLGLAYPAHADDKVKAVASFSILGDMVKNVGGDRVEVVELVGPDGDGHTYSPTPADAKTLASAQIFIVNGLGFEGWMERLEKSSGFKGKKVVASTGVQPIKVEDEHEDHDKHGKDSHEDHAGGHHHHHGDTDPHAWQSLTNGAIYVANIRDGLIAADPDGKAMYEANAEKYLAALKKEDVAVKAAIAALPEARRKVITSHDAFGYFGEAYGLEFMAPEDVSTESEPSAKDVAEIIRQIRKERIPAIFMENITNPKLVEQISRDTGARIGGTLYSDALSGPNGPAPTYLHMFKHNVETLASTLASSS
ncbi:MAG: metal ABC transporter substrate-binding protein [Methyloceanibacter sp.]|uniref:metal ABC transporter substrate-binding protein n=1 Tax=Methyloceanibacter sp. TaxID=1965321 RepID=UPI003C60F436